MRLYLDYDGVLHRNTFPSVEFEALEVFKQAITPLILQGLQIVLSTTWVPTKGFVKAKGFLPPEIRSAVVGTTCNPSLESIETWVQGSRYEQITADATRRGWDKLGWVALDDDAHGWPEGERRSLVHVDARKSLLLEPGRVTELLRKLRVMAPTAIAGPQAAANESTVGATRAPVHALTGIPGARYDDTE